MKISIVTISYNQAAFIEETILSVLNQDYPNIEYIVVDPGSTDGSREIISKYEDQISKIIFEPDSGPVNGLNKGFTFASGDIFAFLNSDDILLENALSIVVEILNKHEVDVLLGNGYKIDNKSHIFDKVYSDKFNLKKFAYGNVTFIQQSVFFRRQAFQTVGGFNEDNRTCWDAELLIDFGLNNLKFLNVKNFLSGFRIHPSSISGSSRLYEQYHIDREILFRKVMHRDPNSYDKIISQYFRFIKLFQNPQKFLYKIGKLSHASA